MKKSIFPRLLVGLLVVTLFAGCLFAGTTTLAMYRAEAAGVSTASIAKFDVRINEVDIPYWSNTMANLNLFATIMDTLNSPATYGQGWLGADAQVRPGKIAPGTHGRVELDVENWSDVAVKIELQVSSTGGTLPTQIVWWLSDGDETAIPAAANTAASPTAALTAGLPAGDVVLDYRYGTNDTLKKLLGYAATESVYLNWGWPYLDGSDKAADGSWSLYGDDAGFDTPVGINPPADTVYTLKLIATQVD